jgi:hypothetical protein
MKYKMTVEKKLSVMIFVTLWVVQIVIRTFLNIQSLKLSLGGSGADLLIFLHNVSSGSQGP